METKEQLVRVIKDWIKLDNEIKTLKKELNIRKDLMKRTSVQLVETMKSNEIECFQTNDGNIMYKKQNVKKPLGKKRMTELLFEYYRGNEEEVNSLNAFLQEHREQTTKEAIVRK